MAIYIDLFAPPPPSSSSSFLMLEIMLNLVFVSFAMYCFKYNKGKVDMLHGYGHLKTQISFAFGLQYFRLSLNTKTKNCTLNMIFFFGYKLFKQFFDSLGTKQQKAQLTQIYFRILCFKAFSKILILVYGAAMQLFLIF